MKPRCHNRPPFSEHVQVQTGWTEDGRRITAYIPDPMSKTCPQHGAMGEATLRPEQWDCDGCRWKPAQIIDGMETPTPGFDLPPYHVESYSYGTMHSVNNRNGFNCLSFKNQPGAKFTTLENATAICKQWNRLAGINGKGEKND